MRTCYYKVHHFTVNHPENFILGYVTTYGDFTYDTDDPRGVLGRIVCRRGLPVDETIGEFHRMIAYVAHNQFGLSEIVTRRARSVIKRSD